MSLDTIDRLVSSHFAAITTKPFEYKGVVYRPQPIRVSPLIFREFHCPPNCGACCKRVTLDYLPHEERPKDFRGSPCYVDFDGRKVQIFSDAQEDHNDTYCRYLRKEDGRCGIHGVHPFECDFAYIAFSVRVGRSALIQRTPGRNWALKRATDGARGALCYLTEPNKQGTSSVVRRLKRLQMWVDHFSLSTVLPAMITWAESGPHVEPLYLNQEFAHDSKDIALETLP